MSDSSNPLVRQHARVLERYKHGDLMPQHEQLGVLGSRRPAKHDQPAAEPDEDEVEQPEGHERS
jgi:hypothetical protein